MNFVCYRPANDSFLIELLDAGRDDYVQTFLNLLSAIQVPSLTQSDKDYFLYYALQLLDNQTTTNPPQYVR